MDIIGEKMKLIFESLKRLVTKPFTIKYPKVKILPPKGFRGMHVWDKKLCIFCDICEMNCPARAIKVYKEERKYVVDLGKCIFCGLCEDLCPTGAIKLGRYYELSEKERRKLILKFDGERKTKK